MSHYDEEALLECINAWVHDVLKFKHAVVVKKIVPELRGAEFAFEITWSGDASAKLRTDLTTLSKSLQEHMGPTALLQLGEARQRSLIVNIMPLPEGAKKRIDAEINYFRRALHASEQWSLKIYVAIFCVAFLNFAYNSLLLHNHWTDYSEPWETPLEFILYHTPFLNYYYDEHE